MNNKLLHKFIVGILFICCSVCIFKNNAYSNEINENNINIDKIEKHWWGYRRYVSSEQISKFASKFDSLAAELSILGGLTTPISFLNPIAGIVTSSIFEITSSYCWLLSTYFIKQDRGNGIIIDFSNGVVFRIKAM